MVIPFSYLTKMCFTVELQSEKNIDAAETSSDHSEPDDDGEVNIPRCYPLGNRVASKIPCAKKLVISLVFIRIGRTVTYYLATS